MKARNLALLAILALTSGCAATTTVDDFRPTTEALDYATGDKVVVLGRRDAGHYETDRSFVECIGKKIRGGDLAVVPEEAFVDSIYPWFEPRTAPKGLGRLKKLFNHDPIRKKVERDRIRYLVWLDGEIETQGVTGNMSCAIGPGGGGCFGFTMWEKTAFYEAIVWDLTDLTEQARIRVDSEGTSYLIGVVAPIPLLSPVKSQACTGLGDQLKSYFTQKD